MKSLALIILFLNSVQSLRCAYQCIFNSLSLNATVPTSACRYLDRDNAQCSVILQIDFKNRVITGELDLETRTTIATLRTETKFFLEKNAIMSTVWYTCTMSNYCDFDFLHELMTDQLMELNLTSIQEKLLDLLYTSIPKPIGVQCNDELCSSNSFCQGELDNMIMPYYNSTSIYGNLSCINLSSTDEFFRITQFYFPFQTQATQMIFRCNIDECNNNQNISEVYAFLHDNFLLPLNYSILDINTSFITTTTSLPSNGSFLFSIYNLIVYVVLILLLI